MKKLLLILPFIVLNLICLAKDEKGYLAEGMYVQYISMNGIEMAKQTMGKDVGIIHDIFFKSYSIMLTDEEGLSKTMKLSYYYTKGLD